MAQRQPGQNDMMAETRPIIDYGWTIGDPNKCAFTLKSYKQRSINSDDYLFAVETKCNDTGYALSRACIPSLFLSKEGIESKVWHVLLAEAENLSFDRWFAAMLFND